MSDEPSDVPKDVPSDDGDVAPPEGESGGEGGRRATILIVVAAAVVLAAIGVGIYLVATSGGKDVAEDPAQPTITDPPQPQVPTSRPEPSSPPVSPPPPSSASAPPPAKPANKNVAAVRSAAEQAATAINKRDAAAMRQLSCDPAANGTVDAFPPGATARLTENPQITGNKATAQIELSIAGSEPAVVPLPLEKRGGKWCVP
jgi:hypothetical protein